MNPLKKLLLGLVASAGLIAGAHAEGPLVPLDKAPNLTNDLAALQIGAKLFVNYCLNCHSAAFMRYTRLQELGLSKKQVEDNLLLTDNNMSETMVSAIDPVQAKEWFGTNPPDLTLVARSRAGHGGTGADYLYTYLRSFYRDDSKATGWNNLVFPNVAMPNVLWELQGQRKASFDKVKKEDGEEVEVFRGWQQLSPGTLTPPQFDQAVGDLVGYLQWMSEPTHNTRIRVGVWVMIFLLLLTLATWRLNAAYWKEVK
ncbi:MAG: Ubiquinol-cytochrome C reductase, cytochrome C1 subunit [Burkholderiaceae bacterium]|jgi:ubiquinol-cytochrome c reductase cytochrome c1 subunit|nr:MAG: Ubiquinol-cytochrome C reductase, cytochrome C1 subunit [Burkholderiaceae bacterium]